MPTNYGAGVRPPAPAPVPQQTTQQSMSQGASPYSAGYTPLQYQTGQDQGAFIQQQNAAFQQWLATPQGAAFAKAQPAGSQWFNQTFGGASHPMGLKPAPKLVPGYIPGQGWVMHPAPANQPRTGSFNYGYPAGSGG
jgi:hypothetical protein